MCKTSLGEHLLPNNLLEESRMNHSDEKLTGSMSNVCLGWFRSKEGSLYLPEIEKVICRVVIILPDLLSTRPGI